MCTLWAGSHHEYGCGNAQLQKSLLIKICSFDLVIEILMDSSTELLPLSHYNYPVGSLKCIL